MKTPFTSKLVIGLLCSGLLLLAGAGCKKSSSSSQADFPKRSGPTPVPAQTNSFNAVAQHLDPGGSFYLYLGTEQFLDGISSKIGDLRQLIGSLPNMNPQERQNVDRLFGMLAGLAKSSGIEEISGVGASGVMVEPGVYVNKFIVHHYPGKNDGLLWSVFGKAPHSLDGLDYLPGNTALAAFTDLDAGLIWKVIKEQIAEAGIPELTQGFDQGAKQMEQNLGISPDKLIASLGGELGFLLTLDGEKTMGIPQPAGNKIEIPEPSIGLMLKVKDDTLFDLFDKFLSKNPQIVKSDKGGVKMRSMRVPVPFLNVNFSVARAGDYLFLATQDTLVQEMLAVKDGKKGLKQSDEFKQKSKGIELVGNSFSYMSPEISRTIHHVIGSIADAQAARGSKDKTVEMLQKFIGEKEDFSFSVGSNTKEGWFVQGHGTQHPAMALVGPTLVGPAVAAGMVLPAMAKAKDRAQTINCVNNLKQVGLAARMWANDHNEVLPSDFLTMSNELNTPKILVCPKDSKVFKPTSWATFDPSQASYVIVSPGAKATEVGKVFARCPIHNNECMVDGSVLQQGRRPGGRGPRPR